MDGVTKCVVVRQIGHDWLDFSDGYQKPGSLKTDI